MTSVYRTGVYSPVGERRGGAMSQVFRPILTPPKKNLISQNLRMRFVESAKSLTNLVSHLESPTLMETKSSGDFSAFRR